MNVFRLAFTGILAGCLSAGSVHLQAQQNHPDRCGTMALLEANFKKDPTLKRRFEQQELQLQRLIAARVANPGAREPAVLNVPVVFHIVLPDPSIVTDEQVLAQLDTLNRDYAGMNGDSVKIPAYFKALFGHAKFRFSLARRTPDNKPTTGIERTVTTQPIFATDDRVKRASTGGADAWNTSDYLNIWLCPMVPIILGYATFPNTSAAELQGVVVDYRSLPGGSYTNFNEGKTITHEVGHYFNLYHIWGDDGSACTGTDNVDDTPNQGGPSSGDLSGVVTDACSITSPGILYQDYMDYTNDDDMAMFTSGQVTRMLTAAMTWRSSLFTSKGSIPVPMHDFDASVQSINTPAARLCANDFTPVITIASKGLITLTSLDITARLDENAPVTTSWAGSLAEQDNVQVSLPAFSTGFGRHLLTIYTSNPNNQADQATANDTLRMTLSYYDVLTPPFSEGFEGSTYPPGGWDIVDEDGAGSWEKNNNAVVIRNYNNANTGTQDYLRLPQIAIDNADSAYMSFRVAAGIAGNTNPSLWDTLEVLVSRDCGVSYTSLYKRWGSNLSTTNRNVTGAYIPVPGEWRKDSVNLSSYIGQGQLLLAFRNTNGEVNNIYLDDITVSKTFINPNLKRRGVLITPSPTTGPVNVDFYPNPANLRGIAIYSSSGQLVARATVGNGAGNGHYSFDLSRYAAGIYVIKVVFTDRVLAQKFMKQ